MNHNQMKLKQLTPVFFFLILLMSACSDEETHSCMVNVQIVYPEEYASLPFDGMKATLTNKAGGTAYTSPCSIGGVATFEVEPGDYAASAHYQTATGLVFNGRIETLSLFPEKDASPRTVELALTRAKTHALVIKEIYFDGCRDQKNVKYLSDQYITLYNNSDEILYLDRLCVAYVDWGYLEESPWMQRDPDMERIPVDYVSWQFPGSGQDYPLVPRAETTIATNAVDHTGGEYQNLNSVNLSTVDWGFYHPILRNVHAPGVSPLNLLLRVGTTAKYTLSTFGPTMMLFTLPVPDVEAYIADPANREMRPGTEGDPDEKHLMIPREWVIDCIECVSTEEELPFKRVPAALDAAAIYISGLGYSGKSFIRKKGIATDGRTIYQDTNNSAQDMEISTPTLKR